MILTARLTSNERDILHAALVDYDVHQTSRAVRTHNAAVLDDVKWRRHVIAELLEQINNR